MNLSSYSIWLIARTTKKHVLENKIKFCIFNYIMNCVLQAPRIKLSPLEYNSFPIQLSYGLQIIICPKMGPEKLNFHYSIQFRIMNFKNNRVFHCDAEAMFFSLTP